MMRVVIRALPLFATAFILGIFFWILYEKGERDCFRQRIDDGSLAPLTWCVCDDGKRCGRRVDGSEP